MEAASSISQRALRSTRNTRCLYAAARQHLHSPSGWASKSSAWNKPSVHGTSRQYHRRAISPRPHIMHHNALPWRFAQPSRQGPELRSRRGYKTIEEAKTRNKFGPFSIFSALLFVGTGVGMYFYFRYEKERMERKRIAEANKGVGKPKVGGHFQLLDQNGQVFDSDEQMKGKFCLVYFGFSHCPDICPEELDKMASMLDFVSEALPPSSPPNTELLPIFITCDPARDTPAVLKSYLKEFHSRLVGLTGAWEDIKAVCRLYRVYFSTPPGVKPGMDYLVDHSIYFYLMDPEGNFVEAIGRQHTADQGAKLIMDHMSDWRG